MTWPRRADVEAIAFLLRIRTENEAKTKQMDEQNSKRGINFRIYCRVVNPDPGPDPEKKFGIGQSRSRSRSRTVLNPDLDPDPELF